MLHTELHSTEGEYLLFCFFPRSQYFCHVAISLIRVAIVIRYVNDLSLSQMQQIN